MSSQFYSNRIGIESLTPAQMKYWKDQGKTYRPILEYRPLTKEEEARLNDEYYVKNNRVGYEKLYSAVRKENGKSKTGKPQFSPTIRQVQAWVSKQEVAQDYKPVLKPKDTKPIMVSEVNDLVQMDYLVMTHDLRYNGHHHILNCIDVLSKRAYSRTLKNQPNTDPTAAQTLVLAKQIFDDIKKKQGRYPKRLQTDNGAHFLASFERAFQPGGDLAEIKYSSSLRYRATSMAVVERFNKTLRDMIRRFCAGPDKNWPAQLQQFIANYNTNRHNTIRMAPNVASDPNPSQQTTQKLQEAKDRLKEKAKLKNKNAMVLGEGDKVRLVNFKKQKSPQYKDEPNWWPEVYEIYHVFRPKNPANPLRYALEPNPPTTIVGNRPGYRGATARGRRQFSVYELLIVGRKGEQGTAEIRVATEIDDTDKIHEEEADDTKLTPTNGQKPKAKPAPTSPPTVRASTRTKQFKPQDLVGKFIKVKWDNEGALSVKAMQDRGDKGTFYKAKVNDYDAKSMKHTIKYVADKVVEYINLSNPKNSDFIPTGNWKLA